MKLAEFFILFNRETIQLEPGRQLVVGVGEENMSCLTAKRNPVIQRLTTGLKNPRVCIHHP